MKMTDYCGIVVVLQMPQITYALNTKSKLWTETENEIETETVKSH